MKFRANQNRQPGRARVFISYKRTEPDSTLALAVRDGLAERYDVFIDRDIPTGAHWARRINQEIERADYFVVLLSHLSVRSEMVVGEIDTARKVAAERPDQHPRILPVRVAFRERMLFPLNAWFQFVNWIDWHTQDDTLQVVDQLLDSIAHGAPPSDPPPGNRRTLGRVYQPESAPTEPPPYSGPSPRGALALESNYYVERQSDSIVRAMVGQTRQGVTIALRGPQQVGKTSLLERAVHNAKAVGKQVARIDFQLFETSALADPRLFYQQFCNRISSELRLDAPIADYWNNGRSDMQTCRQYIEEHVLPQIRGRLVLAIDEIDRLMEASFRDDFFAMLCSWHQRIDMLLVASTEPRLWLDNPFVSPFNVAEKIYLEDFTLGDVDQLNARYGLPLRQDQLTRLFDLVGGHPYLVHYALYNVASGRYSADRFFSHVLSDNSPFSDHLNHLLFRLYGKPHLSGGLRRIIDTHVCRDEHLYHRLQGAGLVRREGQQVVPSRQLYADFFRSRIPAPMWSWDRLWFGMR